MVRLSISDGGLMAYKIWVTAGDNNVCPLCQGYEGRIEQDPDYLPPDITHANCRCQWDDYAKDPQLKLPTTKIDETISQGYRDPYVQRLGTIPVDMDNITKPSILQRLRNWFFNWKS